MHTSSRDLTLCTRFWTLQLCRVHQDLATLSDSDDSSHHREVCALPPFCLFRGVCILTGSASFAVLLHHQPRSSRGRGPRTHLCLHTLFSVERDLSLSLSPSLLSLSPSLAHIHIHAHTSHTHTYTHTRARARTLRSQMFKCLIKRADEIFQRRNRSRSRKAGWRHARHKCLNGLKHFEHSTPIEIAEGGIMSAVCADRSVGSGLW
jgi:hypothetical protein